MRTSDLILIIVGNFARVGLDKIDANLKYDPSTVGVMCILMHFTISKVGCYLYESSAET